MSNCLTMVFSSNYRIVDILVSNNVLVVIGDLNGQWTLVLRYTLTSTGGVDFSNWLYFYKRGQPIGSREKNNRAIIVTD